MKKIRFLIIQSRKIHRIGALITSIPLLIILCSGIILQLKKNIDWVQPTTQNGTGSAPTISFAEIFYKVKTIPEADVSTWRDIERIDVRPERGMLKVRCKNHWEIQLDSSSGKVLQIAYRRSDIIEAIHVGSWFHPQAKLFLFLPVGVIMVILWVSGFVLYFGPKFISHRKKVRDG